jgi:hypothetical protein
MSNKWIKASKDEKSSQLFGVESSGIKDTIINEEAKFLLRNVTDDILVEIRDENKDMVAIRTKRSEEGYLQVYYTPTTIGKKL